MDGRVVLVTGGVRGVGRAISRAFAARGAHVIVNYFHSGAQAPAVLDELNEIGSAELLRGSVADPRQVDTMFDQVRERHGRLDVLVNNAASGALLPLSELDESHWSRAWDTNLRGSLWCARRAAGLMTGGGAIVNLSSIGSSLVISDYATVGTSKAAVEALTRYLAVELAGRDIRVNTASGGLLDGAVAGMFPGSADLVRRVCEATPLQHRLGREEELAELVVFLASPAASWITGQTIVADGGLSLGSMALSVPAPSVPEPEDPAAIAVVGMGVVTPGANDPDELWQVLSGDRHVFGEPRRFDVGSFHSADPDAEDRTYTRESGFITGFVPHPLLRKEIEDGTVPGEESATLWLRHTLYTALTGVGRRDGDRFLAAFGYTADGSQDLEERLVLAGYLARLGRDSEGVSARLRDRYQRLDTAAYEFLPHRVGRNAIEGLLPAATELLMVDAACSSSLYSVDLGVKALREGSCDIAVCGGAFAYSARNLVLFSKLHGLSRSGEVRSFDRDANGVLFSDGAGAVVLKRLGRARADGDQVLGVIAGIGLSCDGKGKAIYAPNARGQEMALRRAYAEADPASVTWLIAHATGTRAGDSTELAALHEVAGQGPPALLSSNKPIVGHTGWTAGLVSLVQALTGLRRGEVPAQRYLRAPIDALRDSRFTPPMARATLPAGARVGVSSFGFGGTNAHLLLGEPGRSEAPAVSTEDVVVVGWSADVPVDDVTAWLRGDGPEPAASFGADYPLPSFDEVRLPPPTLRNMDRTQIMLLRAAARLPAAVREACARLHDTTGVVVGHMGPTRRAVHYALRCYLGDLAVCLGDDLPAELVERVRALVPASTEDSFPGIMPNIIAARLAALWDLHGLNIVVDTGPDSRLDALRCAQRYLWHGDLDLAVVGALNGNTTPEYAEVLAQDRELAEGCFVVVLARETTARERSLPVLGRLKDLISTEPSRNRRTYLGADPLVAVLRRLVRAGKPSVQRVVRRLTPRPPTVVRAALPAVPDGALVLAEQDMPDPAVLPAGGVRHVRVLASVGPDLAAIERLRALHDLAYLAAGRWTGDAGASFGVLLTDAVRDGAPHPATGMFTGLVKSLAREEPGGLSFAVLTDETDWSRGLDLLAEESGRAQDLFVAVHSGGQRFEYDLVPAEPGSREYRRPDVVVSAGGTRGLTAEVLGGLAAPTIYLLGRQAPAEHNVSRAEHIARGRQGSPHRTVAELSAEYDRMCAAAGTARAMRRLAGLGRVHHIVCDLTDADAVRSAVDRIHGEHERVDLLINAAGVHHGGSVRGTPLAAARSVRDTKLLAYLNLHRAFAGRPPGRWVNFGSLLSVLGWPGEADYCSGNDVLLAGASWHGNETTIAWPLWDESGFAAEPLTRDLLREQAALTGLSDEDGVRVFLAELAATDAEVTFLGAAERELLRGHTSRWTPDPRRDGYLDHHLLGGVPTMPGALIAELTVRAAGRSSPLVLRHLRFHAPVSAPPGRTVTYRLHVDRASVRVLSDVVAPDGTVLRKDRLHASVQLADAVEGVPQAIVPEPRGTSMRPGYYVAGSRVELSGPFASLADAYFGDGTATARFAPELGEWTAVFGEYRIPALLLDALFQLTVLASCGDGPVPVPLGVEEVELLTEHNDLELLACHGTGITLVAGEGPSVALAPGGTVLLRVSGVEWEGTRKWSGATVDLSSQAPVTTTPGGS